MHRVLALVGIIACGLARHAAGQGAPPPPSAPLLEHLIGQWTMTGTVRSRPVTYRLEAAWVLQHRFVELHMQDVEHTPPRYEARVFIGPDTLPGRVLAHWLDNFGAAYSVPPATGRVGGDTLTLDFPYPAGAFHDTFTHDPATDSWTIELDAADSAGGWKRFAEYRAVRRCASSGERKTGSGSEGSMRKRRGGVGRPADSAAAPSEPTGSGVEHERETAEEQRTVAEQVREAAEETRGEAESHRGHAEDLRANAERGRLGAEALRAAAESARAAAEEARSAAEEARQAAEAARAAAGEQHALLEEMRATMAAYERAQPGGSPTPPRRRPDGDAT